MRISTFRNRKAKDDHSDQVPVTESIKNVEELNCIQRNVAWAPAIFDGWRAKDQWRSAQLLVLDIDDGNFEAFKALVEQSKEECLVSFTESHRKIKNGKLQADCFRATFFLKDECADKDVYKQTLIDLQKKYKSFGAEQNPDIAKYFWTSTGVSEYVQTYFSGKKITLSKFKKNKEEQTVTKTELSKIPIVTEYQQISESSLDSRRNEFVNKISYVLASHGYSCEEIKGIIYSKPLERPLDERYNEVIEKGYESGKVLLKERLSTQGQNFFKDMGVDEFFKEFALVNNMYCTMHGLVFIKDKFYRDDLVIAAMDVEAMKYKLKNRSKESFKSLLSIWKKDKTEAKIEEMKETIKFKEPNTELCKLIEAITGSVHPLDVAVMRHWIWSIKRKFNHMPTKHHIMPILYGKTRSGKTTAIERLLAPIKDLTMISEMTILNDGRNDFNLLEKLVIFFDELGKADKVVVSNLKQKITSSTVTSRVLGSNQNMAGFNMCSFIGATNEPVVDSIIDPTSARRFYEIKTLTVCDWNLINSIDYGSIWTSVDEMEDIAPIEPFIYELSIAQEQIRAKDFVEEFILELEYTSSEDQSKNVFISSETLYLHFKEWLEGQNKGMLIYARKKFISKVSNYLTRAPQTWISGDKIAKRGFLIEKNCVKAKSIIESKDINLSKEN